MELPLRPLLVLVAVAHEARGLARPLRLARTSHGYEAPGVLLVPVGLRASALPRLEPALTALEPRAVLIAGLAGGLAPDLRPGDLIVASPVLQVDRGVALVPDQALQDRAIKALEAGRLPFRVGPLVTVPEPVPTPEAKARLWQETGALAADMESALLLDWASRRGLPAVAVRAVADGPRDPLPPALLALVAADGRLRPGALAGLLARPGRLRAALALSRRSRVALGRLGTFLDAFASSRP